MGRTPGPMLPFVVVAGAGYTGADRTFREDGAMERSIGSMGSEYRSFHIDPEALPLFRDFDWHSLARRVFIDPGTGLIALMTPSPQHEGYASGADDLVRALDRKYDLRAVLLHSTRWRRRGDPENTGAEPDACFYLGEKAERCAHARRAGDEPLAAFVETNPPDLVVEVERSRGDETKPRFYREIGVPEMWRIDITHSRREVAILDLQALDGPAALPASAVLPLCTPEFVLEALEFAIDGRIRNLDALIDRRANLWRREVASGGQSACIVTMTTRNENYPSKSVHDAISKHPDLIARILARSSGPMGELILVDKLRSLGYFVELDSPHARQSDLLVRTLSGNFFRIEVKTVSKSSNYWLSKRPMDGQADFWVLICLNRKNNIWPNFGEVEFFVLTTKETQEVWDAIPYNNRPAPVGKAKNPDIRRAYIERCLGDTVRSAFHRLPSAA